MSPYRTDDALMKEAMAHGRTQERLREAVSCLKLVRDTVASHRSVKWKLDTIDAAVAGALNRLSRQNGGVIDDMEPLSKGASRD
jgi:hypothetical protein